MGEAVGAQMLLMGVDYHQVKGVKSREYVRDEAGRFAETGGQGSGDVYFSMKSTDTELAIHDALFEAHKGYINESDGKDSLQYYMRQGASQIASASRGMSEVNGEPVTEKAKEASKKLESMIDGSILPMEVRVFRGDGRLPNNLSDAESLVGTTIDNPGLCSMTVRAHVASQFSGSGGVLTSVFLVVDKGLYSAAMWQSK